MAHGALLFALLVALVGCSREPTPDEQSISWAGAPKPIEEMVVQYLDQLEQDDHGPRIFDPAFYAQPTPYFTYKGNDDAVTVALSARVASSLSPIDVFYTDLYWFQNFDPSWLEALDEHPGHAFTVPVGDQQRSLDDMLHPDLAQTCHLSGKLYAVPLSIKGNCLYYRADLVKVPPKTWPELIEISRRVLAEQPADSPLRHGLTFHWQELHTDMYPIMWGYGGGPPGCLRANGTLASPHLASETNLDALEMVYRLIHFDRVTPSVEEMDNRPLALEKELYREFVEGRTLFLIDWTNRAARIHEAIEGATSGDGRKPARDSIGLAPIPHGPNHDRSYSTNGSWGWVLASDPRSPKSIDFVRQLATPHAQLYFFEHHAEVPIYRQEVLAGLPAWNRLLSRPRDYHQQLIELIYGSEERPGVQLRDRPSRKEVNRIIDEALREALRGPLIGAAEAFEPAAWRSSVRTMLSRKDDEIAQFLGRLQRFGVDCRCGPDAESKSTSPSAVSQAAPARDEESGAR